MCGSSTAQEAGSRAEYRGGTYLQQLADDSLRAAYRSALVSLTVKRKKLKKLIASLEQQPDGFVAIEGMNHVHCTTCLIGRHLLLVHVIETRVGRT